MHHRAGKDAETQLRDSDLLVKRYHLIPDSAMSLQNKMHEKRLLPPSPTSCYYKQPIQETESKRKDAAPPLLSVTALCHSALYSSKRWSSCWPAILTEKQVSLPSSALHPSSQSLWPDQSPWTSETCQGIQPNLTQ